MTRPDERIRAMLQARTFLTAVMLPAETKRIAREIRQWARRVLRHYPMDCEIDRLAAGNASAFAVPPQRNR